MVKYRTPFIYFFLIIVLYIYLFNPILVPLGGMGAIKLLYLILFVIFFIWNRQYTSICSVFNKEIKCYLFIFIYVSLRSILYNGGLTTAYTNLVLIIEDVLVPFTIICLLLRTNTDFEKFKRILLIVGAIASVISALCLFFPSLNSFVRTNVISIEEGSYLDLNLFRGFGIAGELTFSYGIIQGFIFSLALFNIKNNKWIIPFLPIIILSILVNARIGLVVAALGLFFFLFQGNKLSVVVVIATAILAVNYLLPVFLDSADVALLSWLNDFFDEFSSLFKEKSIENSGTMNTLFDTMIVLPDNVFQWIFGRGYSIFFGSPSGNSDVGWILQLNMGGIILLFGWFVLFFSLFKKLKLTGMDRWQILLLLGTLVIANTKGDAFSNSGSVRCLLIYMYYYIYEKNSQSSRRYINSVP